MAPLNFCDHAGDDTLDGFDAAPTPKDTDLSGFDAATGRTTIPAGKYLCEVIHGGLMTTRSGKLAYRLELCTLEPVEHAGVTLRKYCTLDNSAAMNRAKNFLAPFGLISQVMLRQEYPPVGKSIFCRCLVTLENSVQYTKSNNIERVFSVTEDPATEATDSEPSAISRFAVPLNPADESRAI